MDKPNKPFALRYESAENKIFSAISESVREDKVPFYLLEGILTNILHQVREQANIERENASKTYRKQLEEYKKGSEGEERGA